VANKKHTDTQRLLPVVDEEKNGVYQEMKTAAFFSFD
jgi:hypothetical protein